MTRKRKASPLDRKDAWPGWEPGWDGHLKMKLREAEKLSFAEKLDWLEEAERFYQTWGGKALHALSKAKASRPPTSS